MANARTLAERLQTRFAETLHRCTADRGEVTVEVGAGDLLAVCTALRDESDLHFETLLDVCGVDYAAYGLTEWKTDESSETGFARGVEPRLFQPEVGSDEQREGSRFAAVYHLLSLKNNHRLRVRAFAPDSDFPVLDSVTRIWSSADWYEREAFDLYGIVFDGHPDLRRLLTDYGFIGHPFRKDFPLSGHVEVRYDPEKGRVIYQPVTIEPRILVPRVIRHDHRYDGRETGEQPDNA